MWTYWVVWQDLQFSGRPQSPGTSQSGRSLSRRSCSPSRYRRQRWWCRPAQLVILLPNSTAQNWLRAHSDKPCNVQRSMSDSWFAEEIANFISLWKCNCPLDQWTLTYFISVCFIVWLTYFICLDLSALLVLNEHQI